MLSPMRIMFNRVLCKIHCSFPSYFGLCQIESYQMWQRLWLWLKNTYTALSDGFKDGLGHNSNSNSVISHCDFLLQPMYDLCTDQMPTLFV